MNIITIDFYWSAFPLWWIWKGVTPGIKRNLFISLGKLTIVIGR